MRRAHRHGVQNELQGSFARGVPLALTVVKTGLDSEFGSFGEKVHSARCLQSNNRKLLGNF
jgi:hypothetical protein